MYSKITIAAPANILSAFNTFLTSTLPAAEQWTGEATDLPSEAGYIFTSEGTSDYVFPLQLIMLYGTDQNYITLRSAELIDMAGETNLFTNPSLEDDTAGAPDDWVLTDTDASFVQTETHYIESFGGYANYADAADPSAIHQVVTLSATDYVISAYVSPSVGTAIGDIDFYFQVDADPVDVAGNLLPSVTSTPLGDGWYRISAGFTGTAVDYKVGIVIGEDQSFIVDGLMLEANTGDDPAAYTNYDGAATVKGAVLRNASGDHKVYFATNAAGIGNNELVLRINADANAISFILGNIDATYEKYNAGFYGRLLTPTGDPADADNSNVADVTGIGIATTTGTNNEGRIKILNDASGRFWSEYEIYDHPVSTHDYWGGGRGAKYHIWGQKDAKIFIKNLFMKDVYWKDRVNVFGVFHNREGFRGYIPNLYSINESLEQFDGEFKIFVTPRHLIARGTCTSNGTTTQLNDNTVDFTDFVKEFDVIRDVKSGRYVRVADGGVAANQLTLLDALPATYAWADDDLYEVYRGIAFDIFPVSFAPGTTVAPSVYPIIAADHTANPDTLNIAGDHTAVFTVGSTFNIVGSSSNDGTYTVASRSFGADTEIVLTTALTDSTADGVIIPLTGPGVEDISYNQLTPNNSRKHDKARRRKIVLGE